MIRLRPYLPTPQRRVPFSWFLCGKKYLDRDLQKYVIELPKGVILYSERTGETYEIVVDKALVVVGTKKVTAAALTDDVRKGYHGTASVKSGRRCKTTSNTVVCKEVTIYLSPKALRVAEVGKCGIVNYAKRYNACIREAIPSFPSVAQIDEALKSAPCRKVAKTLSRQLDEFFAAEPKDGPVSYVESESLVS